MGVGKEMERTTIRRPLHDSGQGDDSRADFAETGYHCATGFLVDKRNRSDFRILALAVLVLAASFYLFFDRSKHVQALASVNPFSVDPFDAVGSFGVLLSLFVALLTLIRAFRPYPGMEITPGGLERILRGAAIVILSVGVTLAADAIAVLRQPIPTVRSPGGRALLGLMALLAIMNGWLARWLAVRLRDSPQPRAALPWQRALLACIAGAVVLGLYPPAWDGGVGGGILTALLGTVIFFVAVWALGTLLFPASPPGDEDMFDDLAAIYGRIKARLGPITRWLDGLETRVRKTPLISAVNWLNPRRHPWSVVAVGGIVLGLALASAEALGEGVSPRPGRFVLVGAVFVGLALAGVLVGYGLLGDFLGIYRREPPRPES